MEGTLAQTCETSATAPDGPTLPATHPIFAKSSLIIAILGMSLMSRCLGQAVYTPYNFIYLAGTGYIGTNDGPGWGATFYLPLAGALDTVGNLYVADSGNNTIRKISPSGTVSTLAGRPGVAGSSDGTGSDALFNSPWGVAVAASGNIYVADT